MIDFVQGVNALTPAFSHASSLVVTIPATGVGNDLLVTVENGDDPASAATVLTVEASGATFVRLGGAWNADGSSSANAEAWIARSIPAGITSVTVTWTAGAVGGVNVGEYAGVRAVGQVVTATGFSANPTISLTSQFAYNRMAAGMSLEGVAIGNFTGASAGTLRASGLALGDGAPDVATCLIDTSAATPSVLTCTGTHAGPYVWAAVAVELWSVPNLLAAQASL